MTRIAIIGIGRLGRCLAQALAGQGEAVVALASRSEQVAAELAARLPGCTAMAAPDAVAAAELVLLTVPDDALEPLAETLPWRAGQAVVHCSGATELTALNAAAQAGAQIGGFHPLQIFSDPAAAVQLLAGSTVAIEAAPPLLDELRRLASLLGMRPMHLPPGTRAAYHAAASFSASFLLSMLDESMRIWASVGLAEEDALQALLPLARGTLQAAGARGLPGALAGPISRGDAGVVAAHLHALGRLGGGHGGFYRVLSLRQLRLARKSGRVSEAALQHMEALLRLDAFDV